MIAYGLIMVAFLGLSAIANHYHNSWIEVQKELAVKVVELNGALEASKLCSENTQRLSKLSEDKQEIVKKAQDQAAIVAKGNQALAQKILGMETNDPNRCNAASKLIKDYKNNKAGEK
jgi:hypothetical protein